MSFPAYENMKASGVPWMGDIPVEWDVIQGRRLFAQKRDPSEPDDEQLSATQKYGVLPQSKFMELEDKKVTLALTGLDGFKQVRIDDFVISLRSFQGGIEHSPYSGCASPAYTILRPNESVHPPFWKYLLKSVGYIEALQSVTDGIRDGKNISYEQFGKVYVPEVPLDEQKAISSFLDVETSKIDGLVSEQRRLIELLKEKRQAVISHAVTKGLNPNAPMKPSGIQWLGDVPQHWSVVRMRRVGEVGQGCAFSHSIQGQESGELPWFKVKDMNRPGNEIEMRTADNYVSVELAEEIRATIFPADTVIFPRVGAALLTNKRRILVTRSITDDNVYGFIPTNIHPRFLYLLLLLVDMERLCSPGLVPTVTFSVIKDLYIPSPPPKEQKEIVESVETQLESFDTLQAEAERAIELLQERRTALISAAVTGKIDVREFAYQETA